MLTALLALSLTPALATAETDDDAVGIVVVDDPYARWRDTRWRVDSQLQLPYAMPLYGAENHELWVVAVDLRLVLACDVDETERTRGRDVRCAVEDVAISAAPWEADAPHAQAVIDETDRHLGALGVRLRVGGDGAVSGVTLEGEVTPTWRRTNVLVENLRQIVRRAVLGLHVAVPERLVLGETWHERHHPLFGLPALRTLATARLPASTGFVGATGSLDAPGVAPESQIDGRRAVPGLLGLPEQPSLRHPFDAIQAPASVGHVLVAHKADPFQGRTLVQSYGEGTVDLGLEIPVTFQGTIGAAATLDPSSGELLEHVWRVELHPTAGSVYADGVAGWPFWHLGRVKRLGSGERSEVGASAAVAPPQTDRGQLPPFPALL